ncbi:MAG: sulfate respiration complex protein HmcE [Thermodesulfobacteriota bacterium]
MYDLVTGPLAWLAFTVFFVGLAVRLVRYIRGLDWQKDRVTYRVNTSYGVKGALRSIVFWLVPYKTSGWRTNPVMTVLFFVMHVGLLVTPIFLKAHNYMLHDAFGISLPTIPDGLADLLTIAVMAAALFILLRRLALPEVRIITDWKDILVLAIAVAPFVTGFCAYHEVGSYDFWIVAHILSGEIMLVAIPFTKLSHFLLFFLSRAQLGMDFGIKRGGMKNKGFAW